MKNDPDQDLRIALSLANGNSPTIKHGPRLEKIAFHIERALRAIQPKPKVFAKTDKHVWRIS